jgi:adenosylcobinamide kinase/adenosylcobinamide-phosphate guanylyltransferase
MITLITGGIKSGKSDFALKLANKYKTKIFLATAVPFNEEMEDKIKAHKKQRDNSWVTLEEPVEIIKELGMASNYDIMLIDCLNMWLNNLFYYNKDINSYINDFEVYLQGNKTSNFIIITNEAGQNLVPFEKLSRDFVNYLGILNQRIAAIANNVYILFAGIPVKLK